MYERVAERAVPQRTRIEHTDPMRFNCVEFITGDGARGWTITGEFGQYTGQRVP